MDHDPRCACDPDKSVGGGQAGGGRRAADAGQWVRERESGWRGVMGAQILSLPINAIAFPPHLDTSEGPMIYV